MTPRAHARDFFHSAYACGSVVEITRCGGRLEMKENEDEERMRYSKIQVAKMKLKQVTTLGGHLYSQEKVA